MLHGGELKFERDSGNMIRFSVECEDGTIDSQFLLDYPEVERLVKGLRHLLSLPAVEAPRNRGKRPASGLTQVDRRRPQ